MPKLEAPQIDTHSQPPSLAWSADRVSIPILFGIAGHIDLDPDFCERIKETLRRLFNDFRERYPNSECVLLSSLAAGADQLAAEVALECGVRVVVPLPFPAKYYAESSAFKNDAEAAQRMLDYVGRTDITSFVVPLEGPIADDDELRWREIIDNPKERRTCYANAGGYITRNCPALIALWDGRGPTPNKPSGTSEMVSCKLYGTTPALYPFPRPLLLRADGGPVYAVHTPRISDRGKSDLPTYEPGALRVLLPPKAEPYPEEIFDWRSTRFRRFLDRLCQVFGFAKPKRSTSAWLDFHGVCQMIEDFNFEAKQNGSAAAGRIAKSQKLPFWQWSESGLIPKNLRRVIVLREVAAELASRADRPAELGVLLLFLLLFAAGVSFQLYAHWEHQASHAPWCLALFLVCLLSGALLVCVSWYFRWNERRLDYRALAEALRVRTFWSVAGIGKSVSDSYLGQLRGEMVWVRRALQTIATPDLFWARAFDVLPDTQKIAQLVVVAESWVTSQAKFFKTQFHRHHRSASRYRRLGFFSAGAGWLLACVLLAFGLVSQLMPQFAGWVEALDIRHPNDILLVVLGSLVLGGGMLVAYCERRSHEELAKQYERMATIFMQGETELGTALNKEDIEGAQKVLVELGQEAILENAQWLVLRRNRPFELLIF